MPLGFRILPMPCRVDAALAARFKALPVANVSDAMARLPAAGAKLRPMHAGGTMAGPAFTVKARPGDNLLVHKALDLAEPGDIIVVDAGGDLTNAIIGEIMSSYAEMRKLGGMVIHGAIRDADALRASSFPVFAAGVTHRGPYKDGPGEINVPIALEGMVIEPGDLILGDGDGVLGVPFDHAEAICRAAEAKQVAETKMLEDIRAGRATERKWVNAALQRAGYAD
jgi:regulator of RNase E activity RraA